MLVSVVIITWNRSELLRRTLDSLRSVTVPPDQAWEVVVVNNNSTDATDEVLKSFSDVLPLRRVFEPLMGASPGRNAGVAAAAGDLLLFTDDDVQVDANWMVAYLEAAKEWPGAGYFGGEIRPHFARGVSNWVRRHESMLTGMLCSRSGGAESRALRLREYPFGPNMAVRRASFARASFDNAIGRTGSGQVRGSEDSLFRLLERQGFSGAWVPSAKVTHYVPRSRATIAYLCRYYHGNGRGTARLDHPAGPHLREQVTTTWKALQGLFSNPGEWPRHLAYVAWHSGRLLETRRLARVESPRRIA